jgi:hypothetical protein
MLILFKFGAAEHLQAFRERGLLHMRTLQYFAEQEENEVRKDRLEGAHNIIQSGNVGELTFENPVTGKFIANSKDLAGPVIIRLDKESSLNVFCMFALTKPQEQLDDSENRKFGDSFVVVLNSEEFVRRIFRAKTSEVLHAEARMVEYFDENKYSRKLGPFLKSSRFRHQQEFRIVVSPGVRDFRELVVGSLEDITTPVLPLAEIDQYVDFSFERARAYGLDA